jgi:hypothetical protein
MPLSPAVYRRERILLIGPPKAGKSTAWLTIAQWLEKTSADAQVFVIDSDKAWEIMGPADGSLDKRVHVYEVENHADWKKAITEIGGAYQPNRGDWLVIDMIDRLWVHAQSGFWDYMHPGQDMGQIALEAKKKNINLGGDYGNNWTVINKLYQDVFQPIINFKGHVLALTPAAEVRQPDRQGNGGDSPAVLDVFGRVGMKPTGQKDLAYQFHSLLVVQRKPDKSRALITVDERVRPAGEERKQLVGETMTDFTLTYLVGAAHWSLGIGK